MEKVDAALQFMSENLIPLIVARSAVIVFGSLLLFAAYIIETNIVPRYFPKFFSSPAFQNRFLRFATNSLYRSYRYNMRMTVLVTGAAYLTLAVFLLGILGHFALRNADQPW